MAVALSTLRHAASMTSGAGRCPPAHNRPLDGHGPIRGASETGAYADQEAGSGFYRKRGKRILDLALGVPALVVVSPALALVAALVRARLGSPVLFRQIRGGWHEEPFELVKIRTMTAEVDAAGNLLPDCDRLPPLGRALRSMSLDEVPELWNVVRGDMSLVGPRPLLVEYLPHYTERQRRRHQVRPGITGLAQIQGRNELTWEQRFELDLRYVETVSLRQDLAILMRTAVAVLGRQGINKDSRTTSDRFDESAVAQSGWPGVANGHQ